MFALVLLLLVPFALLFSASSFFWGRGPLLRPRFWRHGRFHRHHGRYGR